VGKMRAKDGPVACHGDEETEPCSFADQEHSFGCAMYSKRVICPIFVSSTQKCDFKAAS